MAEFTYIQNNLTAGALSPKMWRRVDIDRYNNGAKTTENFIILPQGGVTARPGTLMLLGIADNTTNVRLIPFRANRTSTYMLAFVDEKIYVLKDDQLVIQTTKTITGITNANPAVVTSAGHGLSNGAEVIVANVGGMTEINNAYMPYIVRNVLANTFELEDIDGNAVDSSSWGTYTSGGSAKKLYTITSPYASADIWDLDYVQSIDKVRIVHSDYAPRDLTRASDTSWTLTPLMKDDDATGATLGFTDGPYLTENVSATTLTLSGTNGSVTVTASGVSGINGGSGFQTTDIGRLIHWYDGTNYHYLEITAHTSPTVVTATVKNGPTGGTTATTQWALGAWSRTTGFPSCTTYYQGRSVFANTATERDTIWASVSEDYYNFQPGTSDDDAITLTLNTREANEIQWLSSHKELRVGTIGSEHLVRAASGSVMTPTNAEQIEDNDVGSEKIKPIARDGATLFVQGFGKNIRQFAYDFNVDKFTTTDLNLLNPEISNDGFTQIAFQKIPQEMIWAVRSDGVLTSLTYIPSQNVNGWATHDLNGEVLSVGVVPSSTYQQDLTYVAIRRSINGVDRTYIEILDTEFRNVDVEDAVFSDSAVVVAPVTQAATLTPSATTGQYKLFTANASIFTAADEGKLIEINSGLALIVAYSTDTEVYCDIVTDLSATTAATTGNWYISTDTITGLQHLEGESVVVLTDGSPHPAVTVTDGTITLNYQSIRNIVGFPYDKIIESLDMNIGSGKGETALASKAKIEKVSVALYESVGGYIGYDADNLAPLPALDGSNPLGTSIPLYTGTYNIRWPTGWKDTNKWYFIHSQPLPITLLGVAFIGTVNDSK